MRRRARIRQKALVVDDTTTVDLADYEPHLPLQSAGKALWEQFAASPPFWWTEQDIASFVTFCAMNDQLKKAQRTESGAMVAQLSKECRHWAGELGLSPTSRGRLKLTEAQGVAAAKKIEQLEADNQRKQSAAVDIDELMADD